MDRDGLMIRAARLLLWMTVLTGILYPLVITLIAQIAMPQSARGKLVIKEGRIVGSTLIGQQFISENYFWPRPSATDYETLPSGASNLGPTNAKLITLVQSRKEKLSQYGKELPSDLLFASGSGLDPHISEEAAYFQVSRIAHARGVNQEAVRQLIDQHLKKNRFLGIPRVNVLHLNIALDKELHHGR